MLSSSNFSQFGVVMLFLCQIPCCLLLLFFFLFFTRSGVWSCLLSWIISSFCWSTHSSNCLRKGSWEVNFLNIHLCEMPIFYSHRVMSCWIWKLISNSELKKITKLLYYLLAAKDVNENLTSLNFHSSTSGLIFLSESFQKVLFIPRVLRFYHVVWKWVFSLLGSWPL